MSITWSLVVVVYLISFDVQANAEGVSPVAVCVVGEVCKGTLDDR